MGVGTRVADHTINSIPLIPFPSWEDLKLKSQWRTQPGCARHGTEEAFSPVRRIAR
jgi:hypothetical protein